jgi:hypothetical protein
MSKKNFEKECKRLEALGYALVEHEPYARRAKYTLNGSVKIVGGRK